MVMSMTNSISPRHSEKRIPVFVFGSNLAGVHGAGAARHASFHYGAINGIGKGHVGNSYAIPTKGMRIQTLPIEQIHFYVEDFIAYAKKHPELTFFVTAIGTGLAGYRHEHIAPMFRSAPTNCIFSHNWRPYVGDVVLDGPPMPVGYDPHADETSVSYQHRRFHDDRDHFYVED